MPPQLIWDVRQNNMPILRRVLLAITCWVIGTGLGFALSVGLAGWPNGAGYGIPPIALLPSILFFGFPVWFIAFLPPYFAFKDRCIFWFPLVSGLVGALAGFLGFILILGGHFNNLIKGPADERALAWMPLFIGAFTFLLGSVIKQHYIQRLLGLQGTLPARPCKLKSPQEY